ncbi:protein FAM90A5-like [Bos mutus]|uniref:protein FAM90A5-like n=1 Tax=Bos mutus TaxID=72004 RepID=UPI0038B430A3
MAGHYGWLKACRLFQDQKVRKQNPGPGRQTAPPPQEKDSMVKCKDCGAFGHTARSLRCPMKRWQGALVPLPLGSRFGKENLAWKLQDPPTPGTPNTAEREEEERQRKEEQQRKLLQRFPRRPRGRQPQSWKEELEPGLCLRHPNMPLLIHTSKRKSLQHPDHPRGSPMRRDDVKSSLPTVALISRNLAPASKGHIEAPGKRCAQIPTLTRVNPPKKPRLSPVQTPQQSTPTADLGAFLNLPPPPSTAGRGPRVAACVSRETPAQGQCLDLQPPADRSPSRSVGTVSAAHLLPIIHVPAQPLRMLFLRDGEGCWSCQYTAPLSPRPAEQPAPPAQSPSVDQEPDGHAVPGPRSVLYDDLQVSSSSEESDWNEDTSGN